MSTTRNGAERRFVYHGNAIPLGARIIRVGQEPTPLAVTSPPGSSLSVVGGFSHGESPGSSFRDIFSWGKCIAESSGTVTPDGAAVTTVIASVENVTATNAPIVFKAGLLRAEVVSNHPQSGQPSIAPKDVQFGGPEGMTLDGKPVSVQTDLDDFQRYPTFEGFEKMFRSDASFFKKYRDRFLRAKKAVPKFGEPIPRVSGGYVICSIVESVSWNGTKTIGNVLTKEGFGSLYLGEVLMHEYNRRLTLVRLKMGSLVQAEAAYGEVDPNGSWEP
jgi:hypothetical protein